MKPAHDIVLGMPQAGLPADAAAEAARAERHWRRWRWSGTAISAGAHGLLAILLVAGLPQFGAEARKESPPEKAPLPVEIVTQPPEPPKEKEKAEAEKPEAEIPEPKTPPAIPEPAKALPTPPAPLEKPAPTATKPAEPAATPPPPPAKPPQMAAAPPPPPAAPESPAAPATPPPPAPAARPDMPQSMPAPPPSSGPPPDLSPMPRPAPVPDGGLKLEPEPDVIALPDEKKENPKDKASDVWVLDPLRIDFRDGCGPAQVLATMTLDQRIADGHFRGTLRNNIRSARCKPTSSLYTVELRIVGDEVTMLGAGGFTDRGVTRNGVMLLEDAYGRSVWRKR